MGCGCLLFLIALAFPRATILLLLLFTDWFHGVFRGALIPILGFIFLPYTTLWYSVVIRNWGGIWGFWQVAFLAVAILLDLGVIGGADRRRRADRRD
jgi:hypothetical protein